MNPKYASIDVDSFARSLRFNLSYDPTTGLFTWRVGKACNRLAGTREATGYINIKFQGRKWGAHILAYVYMSGKFPEATVDHINQDKSDNSWDNLRAASRSQNSMNRRRSADNTSGVTGVVWDKQTSQWRVNISVNKRQVFVGNYIRKEAAIAARKIAEAKYYGEFASQE